MTDGHSPSSSPSSRNEAAPIEEHAADRKTPDWLFASTKAFHGWAIGKEVSAADYDAAVEAATNCKTGSLKDDKGNDSSGHV